MSREKIATYQLYERPPAIPVTFKKVDGSVWDLSTGYVPLAKLRDPEGTITTVSSAWLSDGSDGVVNVTVPEFTIAGEYLLEVWATSTSPGTQLGTKKYIIHVSTSIYTGV